MTRESDSLSYWQSTFAPLALSSSLPRTADVVVVGGGLLGTATCYWLAREGRAVTLLERTTLAHGATGRNGGFIRAGLVGSYAEALDQFGHETAHAGMTLTYENRELLRRVLQEEQIDCHYREPGTLQLALTEKESIKQEKEVEALLADHFPAQLLTRNEVQEIIHTPLGPDIRGGRFLPGQSLVHSARLVQGLAQAAQRRGARFYQAEVQESSPLCLPEQERIMAIGISRWKAGVQSPDCLVFSEGLFAEMSSAIPARIRSSPKVKANAGLKAL